MVKKWGQRIYLAVIFLFLYLPFLVLIVLSFNNSKSRVVWGGFTLKWYASCFTDETIMNAFVTTPQPSSRPSSERLPRSASVP